MRIAALGDVAVVGAGRRRARSEGWDAPFSAFVPVLRAADLGVANLEMPVADPGWLLPGRSPEFWNDAEVPAALARAGVGVVSLANNHMMDAGPRGLSRTLEACGAAGLAVAGAGEDLARARRPARLTVRGQRVVLLAYAAGERDAAGPGRPGVAPLEAAVIREDLARWRGEADVLVASVHWGSMYVDYPPPRVVELAAALAAGGADLLIGSHPHVTQGAQRIGRTLVLYSLGDACLDPRAGDVEAKTASDARRHAAVFTTLIADLPGLEVEPFVLDDDGCARAPSPTESAAGLDRLRRLSEGLGDALERFRRESAPQLLRYELESAGQYLRQGRIDRLARLVGGIRPRHLPLIWQALRRLGRTA
jgi:poly-gamma-glutamate synthesis protein (capsule biosynthesis protein)